MFLENKSHIGCHLHVTSSLFFRYVQAVHLNIFSRVFWAPILLIVLTILSQLSCLVKIAKKNVIKHIHVQSPLQFSSLLSRPVFDHPFLLLIEQI